MGTCPPRWRPDCDAVHNPKTPRLYIYGGSYVDGFAGTESIRCRGGSEPVIGGAPETGAGAGPRAAPRRVSAMQQVPRPASERGDVGAGHLSGWYRADQRSAASTGASAAWTRWTASSNSASISGLGSCVRRLTTTATTTLRMKPGTISYMVSESADVPQTNTVTAPATMPESAPATVSFRQNRDRMMVGPNEAPKPAQAKATRPRMVSLRAHARMPATRETASTPNRPSITWVCADA